MAAADPCGWRAAVLGLCEVRGGALWVWGNSDTAAEHARGVTPARNRCGGPCQIETNPD